MAVTIRGSGQIVQQLVSTVSTSTVSTTSTSFVTTSISASITPSNSANKILALVSCAADTGNANTQANITLYRGGTNLGATSNGFAGVFNGSNRSIGDTSFMYLDSPATTSATTYTLYINTGSGSNISLGLQGVPTSIILLEIAYA